MKIFVDTSKVSGIVAGIHSFSDEIWDSWLYKDIMLDSGKIYGLVSEYHQGCMYLSYLIGGRIDFGELKISMDETEIVQEDLAKISWNLEPINEKYKNKTVRKSIEKAIAQSGCKECFDEIAEAFYLSDSRYSLKLKNLSGERWRASAALGYTSGKKIFFAPYESSHFYHSMYDSNLFKALRFLADHGAIVLLPVGSDVFLKDKVDECIYLDANY